MSVPRGPDLQDDAALGQLLSASMRGARMDEASLARMRSAVHAGWREGLADRRRARLRAWSPALAAALAVVAAGAGWLALRPAAVFGDLQGALAGDVLVAPIGAHAPRPPDGTQLRVGEHVEARASVLLVLRAGGQLRARQGSAIELVAPDEVRLVSGALYVDAQGRAPSKPLRVLTPRGVVQHVGTQFEVAIVGEQVRVRVREGSVRLRDDLRVEAGEQITLASDGTTRRSSLAPYDEEWRWVETPVAVVVVDGRNLAYLLRWVARETGRRLEFADERTAVLADSTILHGSVTGLAPELALRAMLATTTLEADVQADRIVIRPRVVATRG